MILVDTSIWVEHFRFGHQPLVEALESCLVVTHPFVIGELSCGRLKARTETLRMLDQLPKAPVASDGEVRHLIESRELFGRGLGWVDLHLLASSLLLPGGELWTWDKALKAVSRGT
jgi:predicted nucleic acid-binding protein